VILKDLHFNLPYFHSDEPAVCTLSVFDMTVDLIGEWTGGVWDVL
jgi:hypothetical protein